MKAVLDVMRKNRKAQALLLVLVAIALADLGFYFLRTAPAYALVSKLEDRSKALRDGMREKRDEYRVYYTFDRGRNEIETFKGLLPRRTEYIDMIKQMRKLAKEAGTKSGEFGAEKKAVQHEGDVDQISFTMPVSGSYASVRKFIYSVERSNLFLSIDNLGLTSVADTDDVSLSIDLSTYVRS